MAVFAKTPWKKFTFRDIKKLTGKKSESYVYDSLKKVVKTGCSRKRKRAMSCFTRLILNP